MLKQRTQQETQRCFRAYSKRKKQLKHVTPTLVNCTPDAAVVRGGCSDLG